MIKNINRGINEFSLITELTKTGKIYKRSYWFDGVLLSDVGYCFPDNKKIIFCSLFTENIYCVALEIDKLPALGKDIAYILYNYWKMKKKK